jgi:hypothetical protein
MAIDSSGRLVLQPSQTFSTSGAVGSVTGAVGSVTGAIGSISGVTLPAAIPSLAQITGALPTDTSIQSDSTSALAALGITAPWVTNTAATNSRVTGTVPSASAIAGAILSNPANLISTDASGRVTLTPAEHSQIQSDAATSILGAIVDGSLTVKQEMLLAQAVLTNNYAITRNPAGHTMTVTYYRQDGTTVVASVVTNYTDSTLSQPTSRSVTLSNLP